ncbi:MAG: glycine zipper 2TM domain-containing protein [Caulobacterales bacterium]|nr:glycine zipper 2TM domain-containing protein [Caulobacterales bacterium]
MRNAKTISALATLAAVGGLAIPATASAQSYYGYQDGYYAQQSQPYYDQCERDQRQGSTAGALLGAVLGAAAGSSIASDGARTEGGVLGGVVGAAIGAGVGRQNAACDSDYYSNQYGRQYDSQYGYQYGNPSSYGYQGYDRGYYDQRGYGQGYGQGYGYGQQSYTIHPSQVYGREDRNGCRSANVSDGRYERRVRVCPDGYGQYRIVD